MNLNKLLLLSEYWSFPLGLPSSTWAVFSAHWLPELHCLSQPTVWMVHSWTKVFQAIPVSELQHCGRLFKYCVAAFFVWKKPHGSIFKYKTIFANHVCTRVKTTFAGVLVNTITSSVIHSSLVICYPPYPHLLPNVMIVHNKMLSITMLYIVFGNCYSVQ